MKTFWVVLVGIWFLWPFPVSAEEPPQESPCPLEGAVALQDEELRSIDGLGLPRAIPETQLSRIILWDEREKKQHTGQSIGVFPGIGNQMDNTVSVHGGP